MLLVPALSPHGGGQWPHLYQEILLLGFSLSWVARTAVTKCHRLSGFRQQSFLIVLEAGNLQPGCQHGCFVASAQFLAWRWPPSCFMLVCSLLWGQGQGLREESMPDSYPLGSLLIRTLTLLQQCAIFMTSFDINYCGLGHPHRDFRGAHTVRGTCHIAPHSAA